MRAADFRRKGFTLTEMLVTLAILSILAMAVLPLAENAVKRGKEIELRRSLRLIRNAIDQYKKLADEKKFEYDEETMGYPPDLETLIRGVEIKKGPEEEGTQIVKFLRRIPKDPMMNSYDWGLRSYQDEQNPQRWGGENIFDVFTRSTGTALDGTKYREW